jgi:cyclic beta-1,2-glucan synthetase
MGYERKRGKLEQFNARLRGDAQSAFSDIVGDPSILESIQYVITLDTDTQLPRDAARTLVGNLAHPLNRPVYDAARGRIVEGYAILQPRASISLTSAGQSRFQPGSPRATRGIDPYTREVSDVYQDVFGEGSFIGKGIYDVDAFRQAVDGRFPENLILSHDLLESGYARSGLVTDVDLIEEHPASVTQAKPAAATAGYAATGSWPAGCCRACRAHPNGMQGPGGNPTRCRRCRWWKLFDNLRRSLVAPALLALLAGGWLLGPDPMWVWTLLVVTVVFLPSVLSTPDRAAAQAGPNATGWCT